MFHKVWLVALKIVYSKLVVPITTWWWLTTSYDEKIGAFCDYHCYMESHIIYIHDSCKHWSLCMQSWSPCKRACLWLGEGCMRVVTYRYINRKRSYSLVCRGMKLTFVCIISFDSHCCLWWWLWNGLEWNFFIVTYGFYLLCNHYYLICSGIWVWFHLCRQEL